MNVLLAIVLAIPGIVARGEESRVLLESAGRIQAFHFFDGGKRVAALSRDRLIVGIVDSGELEHSSETGPSLDPTMRLAVSDKKCRAVYSMGPAIRSMDLKSGEVASAAMGGFTLSPVVGFGADSKDRWVFLGHDDGRVQQFNYPTGKVQQGVKSRGICPGGMLQMCIAESADVLACAGKDGVLRIVDASSLDEEANFAAPEGAVRVLALAPKADRLAVASEGARLKLLEVRKGKEQVAFEGLPGDVCALAFDSKGKLLAACDQTGVLHVWDCKSSRVVLEKQLEKSDAVDLEFSPSGDGIAVAGTGPGILWIPLD